MWQKLWQSRFILAIVAGLALRLYALFLPSHSYDLGTYQAWGELMLAHGPVEFFGKIWSDYLPLPIYLMSLVSLLATWLQLDFAMLFKLVITLIELGLILTIYRLSSRKVRPWVITLIYLSPALIGDSSMWGQLDTLPALLAVIALLTYSRRVTPGLLYGLSLAVKPIFILLSPVLLILSGKSRTTFGNILTSLSVVLLTALPSAPGLSVFGFLQDKILEQASTYPYRTINAFNFWNLGNPLNLWPPDNVTYLGISAHSFGLFIFIILSLFTFNSWRLRGWDRRFAPRVAATILALFYTFTTRMHERHLFFALPFLALASAVNPKLLFTYLILTVCFMLNLWSAYYWVLHDQTWPLSYFTVQLLSWLTTLSSLSLLVWDWPMLWSRVKSWISKHKLLLAILLVASCLRLIAVGHPPDYIFDEVYHAFTGRELLNNHIEAWEWWTTPPEGVAYEWTHPPLAKYGIGLGMLIFGENSFGWRFGSAMMGVAAIAGIYSLAIALSFSQVIALTGAFLLTIEGLNLAQSRIAMNDIYMLAFLLWSLVMGLKKNWKAAALLYGLSLSSKWSALYGLFPLLVIYLHQFKLSFKAILFALRCVLIAVFVYLAAYIPFLTAGHTPAQLLELHRQMWYYHTNLDATHSYQSVPWQWVLALRPVWYFVDYGDRVGNIYALGNPLLNWFGLVALIMTLTKLKKFAYLFLVTCYFSLFAPWIISPRIMFYYHYLPSLTFLTLILASWLADQSGRSRMIILILLTCSFFLLLPVYYGLPMPPWYWDTMFTLFPSWK